VLSAFGTGELHEVWSTTPPRKARLSADERRTRALLATRRRASTTDVATSTAQRRAS
jgi:hypothetical protein